MGEESLLLIDEMVLPDSNAHWRATQLDLTMMIGLASMERTNEQWYRLLDSAELKILQIYLYETTLQDSIIVAVPKNRIETYLGNCASELRSGHSSITYKIL